MIEAAIAFVESTNRPYAVGDHGKAVGILQIHPAVIEDVNAYLAKQGRKERFTLADRLNPVKSRRIFALYCAKYAKLRPQTMPRDEFAARLWHRGPTKFNDRLGATYWAKVKRSMK